MLKIKLIKNQLKPEECEDFQSEYHWLKTVRGYLDEIGYADVENVVVHSAQEGKIEKDQWCEVTLRENDELLVVVKVEGGLLLIAAIWLVKAIVVAAIGYGIGLACNAIFGSKKKTPSFGTVGTGIDDGSPTYSWDGIRTIQDVGVPVAIAYGEMRVGGNVINAYIDSNGDDNYLYMLLSLCEGEIEEIGSVYINDNPSGNYSAITIEKTYGTNSDTIIANFEDLHTTYSQAITLTKDNPYTYTTVGSDIEAVHLLLRLPSGLYSQNSNTGSIGSYSVEYQVEYKLHSAGSWTDAGLTTINTKSRNQVNRTYKLTGLTAGQYDVRITRTSNDSTFNNVADLQLYSVDEIITDDLAYHNTATIGFKGLATNQLSGNTPNFGIIIKGRKIYCPNIENGGSPVDWEDYYYDDDTSQYKLLSDDTVLTMDGYTTQYCANPIWCLRDLLTNDRFGLGDFITTSDMDDDILLEMSRHCDEKVSDGDGGYEKRHRLDIIIDSATSAIDIITQICASFRGMPFYSAGTIKFRIDKEETPSQLFGMGNVIAGSFSQQTKPYNEVYNVVDVQYLDSEQNYQMDVVSVIDEESITAGEPIRRKSVRLFVTKKSYAVREGRYILKQNKYVNETITFKTAIDALACQGADVISFAHDVTQWGLASGRVTAGTSSSVTLDHSVTVESGKTYQIMIRHSDDTLETKTITNGVGSHTVLTISGSFTTTPADDEVYSYGETDSIKKDFRIMGISIDENCEAQVVATEYNSGVYDDTAITLPTNNYSSLSFDIPSVQNLTLVEKLIKLNDGTLESNIEVYFERPDASTYYINRYKKARIYISDNSGASWEYKGETEGTSWIVSGNIVEGDTYRIAVVSVTQDLEEADISASPYDDITIAGKTAAPSDVSSFDVSQEGNMLRFSWDEITDVDADQYELRKGGTWSTADEITKVRATEFMFPVGEIGDITFLIKAIDTSGNYSDTPKSDTLTVVTPPDRNVVVECDLFSGLRMHNATLVDMDLVVTGAYATANSLAGFAREALTLTTADTWEDIEAESQTWATQESEGDLDLNQSYETSGTTRMQSADKFDLGAIFEFKCVLDIDYDDETDNANIDTMINHSEDNITWSGWAEIDATTQYRARYILFGFDVQTDNANEGVTLYGATIFLNAPTALVDWGQDKAVATGGTTINFAQDFTATPKIIAMVVNDVIGFPVVTTKSSTSFTVKVYNTSGSAIGTAEIDWEARGI